MKTKKNRLFVVTFIGLCTFFHFSCKERSSEKIDKFAELVNISGINSCSTSSSASLAKNFDKIIALNKQLKGIYKKQKLEFNHFCTKSNSQIFTSFNFHNNFSKRIRSISLSIIYKKSNVQHLKIGKSITIKNKLGTDFNGCKNFEFNIESKQLHDYIDNHKNSVTSIEDSFSVRVDKITFFNNTEIIRNNVQEQAL